MNAARLAWAYLRKRPLSTALNLLLLALGIATITFLLLVGMQLQQKLARDARDIDLVVGSKGSPLQIILSSVYHLDVPTGNIPVTAARGLLEHRAVRAAIPLALGDSLRGFRIVGTTPAYPALYEARLSAGRLWQAPLEATLGAAVARSTGLGPGERFYGSHGLAEGGQAHEEHAYTVVGILAPTGTALDQVVLTAVETVWQVHAHEQNHEHGHDKRGDEHGGGHGHEAAHHQEHADGHEHGHEDDGHDPAGGHAPEPGPVAEPGSGVRPAHPREAAHAPGNEHEHGPALDLHGNDRNQRPEHVHEPMLRTRDTPPPSAPVTAPRRTPAAHEPAPDKPWYTRDEQEITALLIRYSSPLAAAVFPRHVNSQGALQAASPAYETARLLKLVGLGLDTLRAFGLVLLLTAGIGVFVALYNSLQERQYDLAVMRALGASRWRLLTHILLEGQLLALAGTLLGIALGHLAAALTGMALGTSHPGLISAWTLAPAEGWLLVLGSGLGLVAASLPALRAYRLPVARVLARG